MELNGTRNGNEMRIALKGELDHHCAQTARCEIDAFLLDKSIKVLELDLSGVTFMDSSGLGVILGRYRLMAERGGHMRVRGANASINRILKMAGVYSLVEYKEA